MHVFVTGATGFVGRKLVLRLARDGHHVTAWVRDAARAREVLGAEVEFLETNAGDAELEAVLTDASAVINLAGAPVAQRWTRKARAQMVSSRVDLTRRLAEAFGRVSKPPKVFVSASAVGYYGDAGDARLDEEGPAGEGFLADLSRRWESAASSVERFGTRTVLLRIGIVLGRDGGALPKMMLPFRFGAGAALGTGRQYMPFIHIQDLLELIVASLHDERFHGPINATAPQPVTNAEFSRALGRALSRPVWFRVPAIALRLAMGRQARIVLDSQRVIPARAQSLGFDFAYPDIDSTLADLVQPGGDVRIEPAANPPDAAYVRQRPPRYVLSTEVMLDAPLEEVFGFFQAAENLGAMTPPDMGFRILTTTPISMHKGREIRYRIRIGPAKMQWVTTIEQWSPAGAGGRVASFTDAQQRGPYACWFHQHEFTRVGNRTKMIDRVWYRPPLGPLGEVSHALYVRDKLREIFGFRTEAIALRFGIVTSSVAIAA